MSSISRKPLAGFAAVVALVIAVYAGYLRNSFHFDDFHVIVNNPYIRSLHNVPGFFTGSDTSSVLPANRMWRPLVMSSLALDYRAGNGMQPLWFHLSTLFWFIVLLGCVSILAYRAFQRASPHAGNVWVALFTTAVFGLHPVTAETVNYIVQRADLYSTLGAV